MENMWKFHTANYLIVARIEPCIDLDLLWDDTGKTRDALESGLYTAFDTVVEVFKNNRVIGRASLCGSIYENPSEFFTDHRTSPAEYRNTLAQKAQRRAICHYFPSMVKEAIADARRTLAHV